jgi:hypothetical protein
MLLLVLLLVLVAVFLLDFAATVAALVLLVYSAVLNGVRCAASAITTATAILFLNTSVAQALSGSAVAPALRVHRMVAEYNLPVSF